MSKQYGEPIMVPFDLTADEATLRAWLTKQMSEDLPWLLAYADDGVIWGKWQADGQLLLSIDIFQDVKRYPSIAVELRPLTLQEVHIFGPAGEIRIWSTEQGFEAVLLTDNRISLEALPDEKYLLWHQGPPVKVYPEAGFALLQEGARGQRHAPPIIPQGGQRPKLIVRHYIDYDTEGQAYIALSRLVGLEE